MAAPRVKGQRKSYTRIPVEIRFWSKVKIGRADECWEWTGGTSRGYGTFTVGQRGEHRQQQNAHRWAWVMCNGPVPAGLDVCHSCDNRLCVNINHLWLGTRSDNLRDMWAKGRAWQQTNPEKILRGPAHGRWIDGRKAKKCGANAGPSVCSEAGTADAGNAGVSPAG